MNNYELTDSAINAFHFLHGFLCGCVFLFFCFLVWGYMDSKRSGGAE